MWLLPTSKPHISGHNFRPPTWKVNGNWPLIPAVQRHHCAWSQWNYFELYHLVHSLWNPPVFIWNTCKHRSHTSHRLPSEGKAVWWNSIIYHLRLSLGQRQKVAERISDAKSHNLFPSLRVVLFWKREMEGDKREKGEGGREKKNTSGETNGPISLVKHRFSSSFIKCRRRILFDWLITKSIHHCLTLPHQFDSAILDNLLKMTRRSSLRWPF